ncbi:aldo/keto reductase [Halorarius litoreus]|uniref:aldo/keto reductase n=1 Tax=Halorarius litoreus TaxID=2962676 RepID=UPI0020CC7E0A|nr:aldo/keto reductase [Halorarius litoreus]
MPGEMPRLGLGTYEQTDPDVCAASVETALNLGYRHVDTAQGYDNEAAVGEGIERADVDREDVFLATKLTPENLAYDDVVHSTKASMDRLGVDRIDLLYVHWPLSAYDPADTLPALDELRDRGWIDHVGLSNFLPEQLDEARDHLDSPIFAHQVECHPLFQQDELREYAREDDHWLVAYSPLGKAEIFDHPVIAAVAESHDLPPAQVCLAWLLSKDEVAPIPKATGDHIAENFGALDATLSEEAIERIDEIEAEQRKVDFEAAPWNQH